MGKRSLFPVMGPSIVIGTGLAAPEIGAGPDARPVVEAVARGWPCRDRDGRSAVSPSTGGSHCATGSVDHRQEILRPEIRSVSDVRSGSDSVRDSSAAAPIHPYILNTRATALRRSCGNDVA